MRGRLLILGASGQLGRATAEQVLRRRPAAELILVSRRPAALADLAQRGCEVRPGDLDDPGTLRAALAGAARLLLISTPDLAHRAEQHAAGIRAARAAGVAHVIYTSSLRPEPPNPAVISASHHATELALKRSGLGWTVLREGLYAEYQATEAAAALRSGVLAHNRGDGAVAYVSRQDCAAVAATVLCSAGHRSMTYDVTGPERYDAPRLAALYAELGGRAVTARALDDRAFTALIAQVEGGDDHARYGATLVASFGRAIREGYLSACSDVVERLTGAPARTLRSVLAADVSTQADSSARKGEEPPCKSTMCRS